VFQASFQALKESSTVHKACPFRELAFNGRQVSFEGGGSSLPNCCSAAQAACHAACAAQLAVTLLVRCPTKPQ
jgi:hypothetical protein